MPPKKKLDEGTIIIEGHNPTTYEECVEKIGADFFQSPPTLTTEQKIQRIKDTGIPLKKVILHDVVVSYDGIPETAYYTKGGNNKKSRIAQMWKSEQDSTVLLIQPGVVKMLPWGNVKDAEVLL